MNQEPKPIKEATLTVEYEDGSKHTIRWLGEVTPVSLGINYVNGWPQAQLGGVDLHVTRWPAMSFSQPAPKEPT